MGERSLRRWLGFRVCSMLHQNREQTGALVELAMGFIGRTSMKTFPRKASSAEPRRRVARLLAADQPYPPQSSSRRRGRGMLFNMKAVEQAPAVHCDPEIMGGAPVFVGTRVPAQTLLDYLEAGDPLSEFLEDFPTVSREQAVAALEQAKDALLARADSA